MKFKRKVIALESRLNACRNVITLGVKPNFSDYGKETIAMIQDSEQIYYPSSFYAGLFETGKKLIFPSYQTYVYAQDKIKQTALFQTSGLPHPRTRFFYGCRQKKSIKAHFQFPFIAKIPRGSARGKGVFLIKNDNELDTYNALTHVSYIQDYLKADQDIRVICIGGEVITAYYRVAASNDFRSNISCGGAITDEPVPGEAIELARFAARKFRWNDCGIDIIPFEKKYYIIEANMKYGKQGLKKKGIDYFRLMEQLIENGKI
ncbi:MAG: RimK family alpha-L-glutamate ligase [Proteobacteria bacterium]|nr:RimK family alpha-L-glutamate ligase [Pseudomonadota bacterium]